jgi:hypothetical protein
MWGGQWMYILHPSYANAPFNYVRPYLLLKNDLLSLFNFVEADDSNLSCYSLRIHEMLIRTCIEIEANFRAILIENGYSKSANMNVSDYRLLNRTHRLSEYEIRYPNWRGERATRQPFAAWAQKKPLCWYQAYNRSKHDRNQNFKDANLENLTEAMAGLAILLSSQFSTYSFEPGANALALSGYEDIPDGFEVALDNYFGVKFPTSWTDSERYEFNWSELKNDPDPFRRLDFER